MGKYDKEKIDKLVKYIKERFKVYQTYYQILGLRNQNITDEKVKEAYDKKCRELNLMLRDCPEEESEEIRTTIQEALDDAYTALKTEDSRTNYQKILDSIKGDAR